MSMVTSDQPPALLHAKKAVLIYALQGKPKFPEHIEASRLARIGIKLSVEHRQKLSAAGLGKALSETHRAAIAKALQGKPKLEAHRAAMTKERWGHVA